MPTARRPGRSLLLALIAFLPIAVGANARADADAAEGLARSTYFEGVPYAEARALDEAGVARLIEMASDPDDSTHRAQILELLGMNGGPGAYEAVAAAAAESPSGELDGDAFRTRVAILAALGHLARDDERAWAMLVGKASPTAAAPRWSHGRLRGARLAGLMQRAAVSALAMSGRPEADALLLELRSDPAAGSPELQRHIDSSLELAARVRREGPAAAFGRGRSGDPR